MAAGPQHARRGWLLAGPLVYLAPGGHIGLFIGRQSQAEYWTPILAQVRELSRPGEGDLDGAEQILRARADAGDEWAARRLAELLAQRGDRDEAEQILRARTDAGDESAVSRLAELLAELLEERGDRDDAEQILRARADTGDESAVSRLAELLAGLLAHGDLDKLRTRADAGDRDAATEPAELLEERADPDGALQILRAWANVGDWGCRGGFQPSSQHWPLMAGIVSALTDGSAG